VTLPFIQRFAPALVLAAFVAGCTFTVTSDPTAYPVPSGEIPALAPGAKVDVVNGYPSSSMADMGGHLQCDVKQFTETAVTILRGELTKKGVAVTPGADRKIVLRVMSPMWSQGFGFVRGVVTLEAQLGSKTINAAGEARGTDATRDFNSALTNSVTDLLKRPEFAAWLAGH
jgi:hypothetical protein